ncbi:tetratricopeptide repeat protein [Pedobacter metabolipauper]|uniref:Tetratricopeptide repeat protein n=1 Tax=Pedobacter metabolipauper TaxID=425513 RepID=A0A4R6SZY0_9SPHI|nr:tetratricopeptide repeat protein [Pedobacter metabolipauper]TDQ11682.1 tetratricopeptide repeat protein [Pedobacter metabolipauper]
MNKISFLSPIFFVFICSTAAFAQKSQVQIARNSIGKLQAAINSKQDVKKQLDIIGEGIRASDAAKGDKKTKKWPETWAIKAYLSSYVAIIDSDEGNSDRYYNFAIEAIDSARRLDKFQANSRLIEASVYNVYIKKQDKANVAFKNNDFATAYSLLKDVSDFFPKDTSLAINTALAAQNVRAFDNALTYFKRAKDNGIKDPVVFQNLASIYSSKFEHEQALRTLEDGIKVNPYNSNLTNDYINLLLDNGKYNEAIKVIETTLKVEAGNKLLYFLYGYLHQTNANYSTAELAYNKALTIDENYFDALYQMGLAYVNSANDALKANKPDRAQTFVAMINRAEVALLQAHEINQNDKSTVQLLIDIYSRKNRLDKVQELKAKLEEF